MGVTSRAGSNPVEPTDLFWKDRIVSLYLNQGSLDGWVMVASTGTAQDAVAKARIPIDQWTHVAMTYSAHDPQHHVRRYKVRVYAESLNADQIRRIVGR